MKKFKVGDRVRVRPDLEAGKRYKQDGETYPACVVTAPMAKLAGKIVTIKGSPYSDRYCVAGSSFKWTDEMFEGLAGAEKIVVTTDGETTTARLFSGKEVVKSAAAKCSPQDEFVFETGAVLALDRLLDREKKAEPEVPKFPRKELKTGVFGRMSNGWWFVIVGDSFIYETGKYDHVARVGEGGELMFKSVDCLVKAVSFENARDIARTGKFIWSRPGAKFE